MRTRHAELDLVVAAHGTLLAVEVKAGYAPRCAPRDPTWRPLDRWGPALRLRQARALETLSRELAGIEHRALLGCEVQLERGRRGLRMAWVSPQPGALPRRAPGLTCSTPPAPPPRRTSR